MNQETFVEVDDPYTLPKEAISEPPKSWWAALRMTGPGIVLAGTIVGSGELLLTTSLGATSGFIFLWLILLSCVIKVFVQVELGRYAISSGKPTLGALNSLGGPRWGANLFVWWWFLMMLATIFQLGAMTGTVGQSLNLAFPQLSTITADAAQGIPYLATETVARPELSWAVITCLVAIVLLWSGNYSRLEKITTFLVVTATLLTVSATIALPFTKYPIDWSSVLEGLQFKLPAVNAAALATALGVFGVTGVGATELFYYPYWCLEKGYARYVGIDDGTEQWLTRAKGWIRVMYLDAWVSMIVFTISTVSFYAMGAAVLHPQGLTPQGTKMIETLSRMFVDSFGKWTEIVFLLCAGTVLFKTLYLASAGNARLAADFISEAGFVRYNKSGARVRWIRRFSIFFPILALVLFYCFTDPKLMTVVGGFAQAVTLPMIAGVTVYFRYAKTDKRLAPSFAWDIMLWIAAISITIVASYVAIKNVVDLYLYFRA